MNTFVIRIDKVQRVVWCHNHARRQRVLPDRNCHNGSYVKKKTKTFTSISQLLFLFASNSKFLSPCATAATAANKTTKVIVLSFLS
jgi:hypothetical protein